MTKFEEVLNKVIFNGVAPRTNEKFYLKRTLLRVFSNWHSDEEFQEKATKLTFAEEEIEELGDKIGQLESQLQQQALPVVPKDVAKLPPFDDMKEYVLDERLLTIREYLNKLDDKSNSDITEAEAWCMIHEDIVYRAMLDGYTVEKPQLFYLKNKITGRYIYRNRKKDDFYEVGAEAASKFTKLELDKLDTGSYERIEVTE